MAHASAMLIPLILDERASGASRVPAQSGQSVKVTARSTNALMCGCIDSTSLASIDFWIFGIRPSKVTLMPSTLMRVGSLYSRSCNCRLVKFLIGWSGSKKPLAR